MDKKRAGNLWVLIFLTIVLIGLSYLPYHFINNTSDKNLYGLLYVPIVGGWIWLFIMFEKHLNN